VLHSHDNRLRDPIDFDHRICVLLAVAVGQVDDFSLQEIFAMKLHENLRGFRDVNVANSKMDPGVSHIYLGYFPRGDFALSFVWVFRKLGACQGGQRNAFSRQTQRENDRTVSSCFWRSSVTPGPSAGKSVPGF
jgi:hypothetical protein